MKMERQKTKKLIESMDLFKSTIGGAIVGGGVYLLFRGLVPKSHAISPAINKLDDSELKHHTIPPIIIKSDYNESEPIEFQTNGLFEESDHLFKDDNSAAAILATKVYKWLDFSPVLGITPFLEVFRYNETTGNYPTIVFPSSRGIKVGIWLQYERRQGEWKWEGSATGDSPTPEPQILILGDTKDFTVICEKLTKNISHNPQTRKYKHTFNKSKKWRFGKVLVYNFRNGLFETKDFDVYRLEFDNHIR
jgi:hypothetical protein